MDSIKIDLQPTLRADYSVTLMDNLGTALVASSDFFRPDGSYSGLGLSLQASPLRDCKAPTAVDAEMFFRAVALLNAAPQMLLELQELAEAVRQGPPEKIGYGLETSKAFDAGWTSALNMIFERMEGARAAIALATTHPLHDAMESEQREQELAAEARRPVEHDDDRDHLTDDNTDFGDPDPYLYSDEDTGEDTNVELLQGASDAANEAAAETQLLGGAA